MPTLTTCTVAELPATPAYGDLARVTDCTTDAADAGFGTPVVGGGAVTVRVRFDGSVWRIAY